MRKLMLLIAAVALLCLPAVAQTTAVTITGTNFQNAKETLLKSGQMSWLPVSAQGVPLPGFVSPGGGQVTASAVTCSIVNGAITGTCKIKPSDLSFPTGVCYKVTVKDTTTNQPVLGPYMCVQPISTTNDWCAAGTCDFDNYHPDLSPMAMVQAGPTGPQGPAGAGFITGLASDGSSGITVTGGVASKTQNGTRIVQAAEEVQAAVDDLPTSGGHAHIPKGSRNFAGVVQDEHSASPHNLANPLVISGDGMAATTLTHTGSGAAIKSWMKSQAFLRLREFNIVGNLSATGPCIDLANDPGDATHSYSSSDFELDNVAVTNCPVAAGGILIQALSPIANPTGNAYGFLLKNVQATGGGTGGAYGLKVKGDVGVPSVTIIGGALQGYTRNLIFGGGERGNSSTKHLASISGCNLQGSASAAFTVDNSILAGFMIGCYFEQSTNNPPFQTTNSDNTKGMGYLRAFLFAGNSLGSSTSPPAYPFQHEQNGVNNSGNVAMFANDFSGCTTAAIKLDGLANSIIGFGDNLDVKCAHHFNYSNNFSKVTVNDVRNGVVVLASTNGTPQPQLGVGVNGWRNDAVLLTNTSLTSNIATYTVTSTASIMQGATVTVANSSHDATFNGSLTVLAVPTDSTFTVSITHADIASAADTGTVTPANANPIQAMLHVGAQQAGAAVSTRNGTKTTDGIKVVAGKGQAVTGGAAHTAGAGGGNSMTAGDGGNAPSGDNVGPGGSNTITAGRKGGGGGGTSAEDGVNLINGVVKLDTTGYTKPACDVNHRGNTWHNRASSGTADTWEVCDKDAADAYAYRAVWHNNINQNQVAFYKIVTHASLDLASVNTAACTAETTETVTGAVFGDHCDVDSSSTLEAGGFFVCKVTATDTVKWQFCNLSGGAIDRASATYTVRTIR